MPMEIWLFAAFMLALLALMAYGAYLVARIAGIYLRLRGLSRQRDYEMLLYAALPSAEADQLTALFPCGAGDRLLGEVLERMGRDTDGELREKVVLLYRELGFYERRRREAGKGRPAGRARAREALAAMGLDPGTDPAGGEG